jgi:hypothetical protein
MIAATVAIPVQFPDRFPGRKRKMGLLPRAAKMPKSWENRALGSKYLAVPEGRREGEMEGRTDGGFSSLAGLPLLVQTALHGVTVQHGIFNFTRYFASSYHKAIQNYPIPCIVLPGHIDKTVCFGISRNTGPGIWRRVLSSQQPREKIHTM